MIALKSDGTVFCQDCIKAISTVSTTRLQDGDGALRKGVELAHIRNDGVGKMSKIFIERSVMRGQDLFYSTRCLTHVHRVRLHHRMASPFLTQHSV